MTSPALSLAALSLLLAVSGCSDGGGSPDGGDDTAVEREAPRLGPHDGRDLLPADLERVGVGDTAPDFTLASYAGGAVTLSDFRGSKDVVLVFYRGHW